MKYKKSEDLLNTTFNNHIAQYMGSIFEILIKVLKLLKTEILDEEDSRLVDFLAYGKLIARAMEIDVKEFEQAFATIRMRSLLKFVKNFPEIEIMLKVLIDRPNHELVGTSKELMEIIRAQDDVDVDTLTKNPATFSKKMNDNKELLSKLGIEYQELNGKVKKRKVTLTTQGLQSFAGSSLYNNSYIYKNNKETVELPMLDGGVSDIFRDDVKAELHEIA